MAPGTTITLPVPCLVVLVGVAGAGKSTWARRNFEASHVVSSDAIRALVGEGEADQAASKDAFAILDDVVERRLRRRLTTVVDTLGLDQKRRAAYRAMAAAAGVPCIAVAIEAEPAIVRRQNRSRDKRVPDKVVADQLAKWRGIVEALDHEGFDGVHRVVQIPDGPQADEVAVQNGDPPPAPVSSAGAGAPVELVPATMIRNRPSAAPRPALGGEPSANARRGLRFGLLISRFNLQGGPAELGERLAEIVCAAERSGFDSVWVMDHFRQTPQGGRAWEDMLESYVTLSYLAARTTTIRLGALVTGITYRNVAHLAKIIASLDVLSGGRANCGLGLGWFKQEHDAYGWRFPPVAERYAIVEDALRLLPTMWGPGNKPFHGAMLTVPDTMCYPRPLQAKIPILLGGSGERRTLRLVARHADACNLFGEADVVRHKVAVLHRHCAEAGRDPATVEVTQLSNVFVAESAEAVRAAAARLRPGTMSAERFARSINAGTAEQHIDRFANLAGAGVHTAIVTITDLQSAEQVERLSPVVGAFS